MNGFERDVAGIGALDDDVRRRLYLYVCAQPEPISRDQAAEALGLPHHQVKFGLDKLEAAGLLESDYARLTGRTGPGAGRPAKIYRRTETEIAVSLPGREYALAGELMAEAIAASAASGTPVEEALDRAARARGRELAAGVKPARSFERALEVAMATLSEFGYEPRREDERAVMANCPFHALAEKHTELVCHMNESLLCGLVEELAPAVLSARLDPSSERCCVVLGRA